MSARAAPEDVAGAGAPARSRYLRVDGGGEEALGADPVAGADARGRRGPAQALPRADGRAHARRSDERRRAAARGPAPGRRAPRAGQRWRQGVAEPFPSGGAAWRAHETGRAPWGVWGGQEGDIAVGRG